MPPPGRGRPAVRQGFRGIDTACQPKHYREDLVGAALLQLQQEGAPIPAFGVCDRGGGAGSGFSDPPPKFWGRGGPSVGSKSPHDIRDAPPHLLASFNTTTNDITRPPVGGGRSVWGRTRTPALGQGPMVGRVSIPVPLTASSVGLRFVCLGIHHQKQSKLLMKISQFFWARFFFKLGK